MGECPECGGEVDRDDWTVEETGCDWTHPDDCHTCGRTFCDGSC